jgi:hypothetical protein
VLYRFHVLVAEQASGMVRQSPSPQMLGRPASVEVCKLVEKFDAVRRPGIPGKLPGITEQAE